MIPDRETIYQALFDLASSSANYVTVSRKFRLWQDVPQSERPALFQYEGGRELWERGSEAVPPKRTLECRLFIYVWAKNELTPSALLNPLLDALDRVLEPPPPQAPHLMPKQTLGGLVSHAWVEGEVMKEPGDLDGDGIAIVPIRILIP